MTEKIQRFFHSLALSLGKFLGNIAKRLENEDSAFFALLTGIVFVAVLIGLTLLVVR